VELGRVAVGHNSGRPTSSTFTSQASSDIQDISKEQYERRSDFHAVSSDLSLSDAKDLLILASFRLVKPVSH